MKNASPNGIRRILSRGNFSRKYLTRHVKKKNRKTSASRRADTQKMLFRFTTISICGNTAEPVRKEQNKRGRRTGCISTGRRFLFYNRKDWCVFRYSLGVIRYRSLNTRLKVRWLSNPLLMQISVIGRFVFSSPEQAEFSRKPFRY